MPKGQHAKASEPSSDVMKAQAFGAVISNEAAPAALTDILAEAPPIPAGSTPSMQPPNEVMEEETTTGVAAWVNGKKVTALWSDHANRNSWIQIQGIGWKKLESSSDSAIVNMSMMCAHAEQANANVNVHIEADGKVHQIYVW